MRAQNAIQEQYDVTLSRKGEGAEKSYTRYLYQAGLDKILKKCGEETFEAVIAAKEDDKLETVGELNDVLYHVTVLLCQQDVALEAVMEELNARCQTKGCSIDQLYGIVEERSREEATDDGSHYTAYLVSKGLNKVLKKVGEACALLLIAGKAQIPTAIAAETANLIYHLMVMMLLKGITMDDLAEELERRSQKTGNLKVFHQTNVNS